MTRGPLSPFAGADPPFTEKRWRPSGVPVRLAGERNARRCKRDGTNGKQRRGPAPEARSGAAARSREAQALGQGGARRGVAGAGDRGPRHHLPARQPRHRRVLEHRAVLAAAPDRGRRSAPVPGAGPRHGGQRHPAGRRGLAAAAEHPEPAGLQPLGALAAAPGRHRRAHAGARRVGFPVPRSRRPTRTSRATPSSAPCSTGTGRRTSRADRRRRSWAASSSICGKPTSTAIKP